MKILMLNGSNKNNGNTATALKYIGSILENQDVDYEIFNIGPLPIRDCIGCHQCNDEGCIFNDDTVNEFVAKLKEADGLIVGTPVYYAHPSGRVLSFLDRVFYSSSKYFTHKPAASIAIARRSGTTASFDVLNKYFTISQMPIVSSTYWNNIYGQKPGEVNDDDEGLQTLRNLALNMVWLIKSIEYGKEKGLSLPDTKKENFTNFIR